MQTNTFIEHISDWHAGLMIDRTNRTARNVALTGLTSKNGYRYSEPALQEAVTLYDQKPVFLDHAADKSRPHERSARDLVGTIANPRYEGGRIRGDIRVLDTESGRTFLALAESDAPGVGMSHVVLAQRPDIDGVVAHILDVVSVDAVVFPATTQTFRESLEPDDLELVDLDNSGQRAAAMPDAGPALTEADVDRTPPADNVTEMSAQLSLLLRERDELLQQVQVLREREADELRERQIQRDLEEAGLPALALTQEFRQQLAQFEKGHRCRMIRELGQLVEAAHRPPTRSAERFGTARHAAAAEHATFVAVIRRHGG